MDIQKAIEILSNFDMQVTAKADGAYQSTIGEKACKYAVEALKELQEYRKLGTVKELLVEREKQIAKTPDYEGDGYADGQLVLDTWICPNCGEYYEVGYHDYDYCPKCGQHIQHEDWERD